MLRRNIDGKGLIVGIAILFVATNVIPIVDANFMKMPEGKKVTANFVNSEKKSKIQFTTTTTVRQNKLMKSCCQKVRRLN